METFKAIKSKNILETKIERSGITNTFTVGDYVNDYNDYSKQLKENKGKVTVEELTKQSAEKAVSQITKLDERTKRACYIWVNAEINKSPAEKNVKTLKSFIKELKTRFEQIKKETGVDILALTDEKNDK